MREGKFRHHNLAAAAQKPYECVIGWFTHYIIGVIYSLLLVILASPSWLQAPTVLPALALGIVTVAFPFLVMQPAFGMGIAGSNAPNPLAIRLRSLMNHTVFGLGLYLTALLMR